MTIQSEAARLLSVSRTTIRRRSRRVRVFITVSALLALALIGLWIGGQYGLGILRSWK